VGISSVPRVSIVMASFNHESFIHECIQSALGQTFQDFEFIITDDGSTDGTVDSVKAFHDPRIVLEVFPRNEGACVALNNSIRKARGEFVAVLNSDDAWMPERLARQVAFLDSHPELGAVFSRLELVTEAGEPVKSDEYWFASVLEQENRSRYAWLNYFFYSGNCLCHPSILIRRKCYEQTGLLNPRMANLPDLDLWVRLCLKYEIYILDEKLVRFRIHADQSNASGDRPSSRVRGSFEYLQILDHYLEIKDSETLLKVFPDAGKYGMVSDKYIPYFLGRQALEAKTSVVWLWGLKTLYGFLGDEASARGLRESYGFRYSDLIKLTSEYDVFKVNEITVRPSAVDLFKYAARNPAGAFNLVLLHTLVELNKNQEPKDEKTVGGRTGDSSQPTSRIARYGRLLLRALKNPGAAFKVLRTITNNVEVEANIMLNNAKTGRNSRAK